MFVFEAKLFLIALGALMCVYGCYFGVIALAGFRRRVRHYPVCAPKTKFALVVAARNEAAVIGHLVDSLRAQNYPTELFDVIVAPNNCTDDTAGVAAAHGAILFTPEGVIRSKGEVLQQIVSRMILRKDYDAMCVFDADNLVDSEFLARMNDAVCAGAHVIQGFRDSKNYGQSAMSGCYSICYWMVNHFYNRGRAALGLSALVNGSGFAVTADLLERVGGWNTKTMTEDYEFSAQCVLAGERVHFCDEARVYDEQPIAFKESWKQRRRWTTGSVQGLQAYGGLLFSHALKQRSKMALDMFLTFLSPVVQICGLVTGLLSAVLALMGTGVVLYGTVLRGFTLCAITVGLGLFGMIVGSMIAALVTICLQRVPLRRLGKSVLSYWLFLLTFSVLTVLGFCKQKKTWDPIAHTSAKSLAQLQKDNA